MLIKNDIISPFDLSDSLPLSSTVRYSILLIIKNDSNKVVMAKIYTLGTLCQKRKLITTNDDKKPAAIGMGRPINNFLLFMSLERKVNLINL